VAAYSFLTRFPRPMINQIIRLRIYWKIRLRLTHSGIQSFQPPVQEVDQPATLEENWKEVCSVLESMHGLAHLRIWLYYPYPYTVEVMLLDQLRDVSVKSRTRFVVVLPYIPKEHVWPEMATQTPGLHYSIKRKSRRKEEFVAKTEFSYPRECTAFEHRLIWHNDRTIYPPLSVLADVVPTRYSRFMRHFTGRRRSIVFICNGSPETRTKRYSNYMRHITRSLHMERKSRNGHEQQ
jgi:hypothetical protein